MNDAEPTLLLTNDSGSSLLIAPNPEAGNVRFFAADGSTTLLLQGDGKIFVRGEEVADNKRVYDALCQFLGRSLGFPPQKPNSHLENYLCGLEWLIADRASEMLPLDVAVDVQRRRAFDVPVGTIRVVLETCT